MSIEKLIKRKSTLTVEIEKMDKICSSARYYGATILSGYDATEIKFDGQISNCKYSSMISHGLNNVLKAMKSELEFINGKISKADEILKGLDNV